MQSSFQTLLVQNLNYSTNKEEIKKHFEQIGEVSKIELVLDKNENSKGIAYVTYKNPEDARLASKVLNKTVLDGNKLYLDISCIENEDLNQSSEEIGELLKQQTSKMIEISSSINKKRLDFIKDIRDTIDYGIERTFDRLNSNFEQNFDCIVEKATDKLYQNFKENYYQRFVAQTVSTLEKELNNTISKGIISFNEKIDDLIVQKFSAINKSLKNNLADYINDMNDVNSNFTKTFKQNIQEVLDQEIQNNRSQATSNSHDNSSTTSPLIGDTLKHYENQRMSQDHNNTAYDNKKRMKILYNQSDVDYFQQQPPFYAYTS